MLILSTAIYVVITMMEQFDVTHLSNISFSHDTVPKRTQQQVVNARN
jgi:hypothetical protein